MPTILKIEGFRFFFFSNEHTPKHIHIQKQEKYAKINIENLKIINNYRFNSKELNKIKEITKNNQNKFLKAWDEYFQN